jgi:parallel beta-helix repeat protein
MREDMKTLDKYPVVLYKILVVGVIILLIGLCINPSTGNIIDKTTIMDSRPDGYIQNLIDNANDGDIIYIPSGVYYENIIIDKPISLIGEDKSTTIVDGNDNGIVVEISSNFVNLTEFTVRNSNNIGIYIVDSKFCRISENIIEYHINQNNVAEGIAIKDSSYIAISRNIITNCNTGIFLWHRNDNCSVSDNIITNNGDGIEMWDVIHCNISNNIIKNNSYSGIFGSLGMWPNGPNYNMIYGNTIIDSGGHGIELIYGDFNYITLNYITQTNFSISKRHGYSGITLYHGANNNNISWNTITNEWVAIHISNSYNNTIYMNNISNCIYGIIIENRDNQSFFNINDINGKQSYVIRNNFIRVLFPARSLFRSHELYSNSYWDGNYWGRSRSVPKAIFGFHKIISILRFWGIPAKIQFDWHPAKEPYDIKV